MIRELCIYNLNSLNLIKTIKVNNKIAFDQLLESKEILNFDTLAALFEKLEPIKIEEIMGKWKGGYFKTGNLIDLTLRNFGIWRWTGKTFHSENNVNALMHESLGLKFNLPFIGNARMREISFRGKVSTSMIYNYLPIIDHFRKVDDNTLLGVMDVKGEITLYFYP